MNSNILNETSEQKLVLLIDDDPDELEIYNIAISSLSFPCLCMLTQNRDSTFKLLEHITPDLIVMDYSIPGKNGLDILLEIRTLQAINNIPIVFCSTVMSDQIRSKALEAGATYCIKKQFELRDIANLLNSIFGIEK